MKKPLNREILAGWLYGATLAPATRTSRNRAATMVLAVSMALNACVSATDAVTALPPESGASVAIDSAIARVVHEADGRFVVLFPTESPRLAAPGIPAPGEWLVGRNREWGAMYAARFQLGTGNALRSTLQLNARAEAARAFAGVEAGFSTMEPSGRLPARVPVNFSMGQTPSQADVASGAAFFLGDACTALLALAVAPEGPEIVPIPQQAQVQARAARSIAWLHSQLPLLQAADAVAPNRLFFNARALLACGRLSENVILGQAADAFVQRALELQAEDGWYTEGGGWDTSYQAVTLEIGADVHALLREGPTRDSLGASLRGGAAWLSRRVDAQGRVDSRDNRRTCSGGESFLGAPKKLALASVVLGLGRVTASVGEVPGVEAAVRRVSAWARVNPSVDPCFEAAD